MSPKVVYLVPYCTKGYLFPITILRKELNGPEGIRVIRYHLVIDPIDYQLISIPNPITLTIPENIVNINISIYSEEYNILQLWWI